tara:strand:+ start:654 stop:1259 length:606 start_codon:yes stop_codon:yes gene_type:complete
MVKDLKNRMSIAHLQGVIEGMGYKWFSKGDYNVNLIGVRNPNLVANSFDDTMLCAFKIQGVWQLKEWRITTDAGKFWLQHPMNSKGCAILVPDQYLGAYAIGLHRGAYKALCQRGEVEVYRDDNKDQILDFNEASKQWGQFGINIHRAGEDSQVVGKWSAGCQVVKRRTDFDDLMQICTKASKQWGNSFTYTLIKEQDLEI